MSLSFCNFYPLDNIVDIEFKGIATKWNEQYDLVTIGNSKYTFPENNGIGLKIKKISLKNELPKEIEALRLNQNLIYVITSTKYPILYVGITEKGFINGVFGQGRLSHHIRKFLAIHSVSTNHTNGWRLHAIERYRASISTGLPTPDLSDIRISIATCEKSPKEHEGYVLDEFESKLTRKYPNLQILNSAKTRRGPINIKFPQNLESLENQMTI